MEECNEQLKKELEITKTQNIKGKNVNIDEIVGIFYKLYSKQTEKIVKNLKQEITDLKQEQKILIKNMFLLKQRVLEQFGEFFVKELDASMLKNNEYIRIAL